MIDEKRTCVPLNISVSPEYVARIKQASAERGLTVSDLIRRAIDALLGNGPAASRPPAEPPR
jgi:Ribbon-helix-helix protein, copG family